MYRNTAAIIRPELQAVVEEAALADQYFIASRVYPVYMSNVKTAEFQKITKSLGELLASDTGDVTLRAPKAAYKEVDRTYEKDTYTCKDRGLKEVVDDSLANELNRFFDVESTAAKLVLRNMLIAYEKRVADRVFHATNWGTPTNSKVAYTEANIDTIDFPFDLEEAIAKVQKRGEMVNTIILNRNVWKRIRRSKLLREYLFGTQGGNQMINTELMRGAFGVENWLIAESVMSTAKKGKSVTDALITYLWADTYVWIGCVMGGDLSAGGAGRTIVWNEDAPGLFITETYRDEDRRSDIVRVRQHTDEKEINLNCGTLIATQYA